MRVAYFDCFHGASGDMLLASLLDAGLELAALEHVLAALPLDGYRLDHERTLSHGVSGSRLRVHVHEPQPERSWAEIRALLVASQLSPRSRTPALRVFERLARVEAAIHGVPVEEVHFHEVGAVDSIVDVVGVCVGLELFSIERVYASALPLGRGHVATQHGELPLPAPATLALLADVGAPVLPAPDDETGELLTPTAAALLAELAQFQQPPLQVDRVGYGFGQRKFRRLNGLRVWLGTQEQLAATDEQHETVVELCCNLDDASGELVAYTIEQLLAAGALDAWAAPLVMKKGRPAMQLACLAHPGEVATLAALMLRETPTLGVRWQNMERLAAERRLITVETPWGEVRLKQKLINGEVLTSAPEYEDCAALARAHNIPLAQVYTAATAALQRSHEQEA